MAELKRTRQRAAILRLLANAEGPLTAEELHAALRGEFPAAALSTVYRNLERFLQEGLAQKEDFRDGAARYTAAQGHGHYLVCTGCARRVRLTQCPLHGLEQELARGTGFTVESHSLTLYGKCPQCRAREENRGKKPGGA